VSKQFWILLVAGLAIVGAGLGLLLVGTKGNHLELTGTILHTRVLALNAKASLVVIDFRVRNPSDVPFVVKSATIQLTPSSGETLDGTPISKPDVENVFKYEPLLGPKFNDLLSIRDKIAPHQSMDRMVAARFDLPDSQIDARKSVQLRIEDMDGTVADLGEKALPEKTRK
jgi:hypothetical protein